MCSHLRMSGADQPVAEPIGGIDLATRFAAASGDFARRQLRGGELPTGSWLAVAARQLLCLVELVPDRHRTSFLFLYWEKWTRHMSPAQRVDLSHQANRFAATIPDMAGDLVDQPARQHRLALRAIAADQRPTASAPITYLLFELAHLSLDQLGIPIPARVVAARALRGALISGLDVAALFSPHVGTPVGIGQHQERPR
jgi:hypothetical protein